MYFAKRIAMVVVAAATLTAAGGAAAGPVTYGPNTFASGLALLSDFQQSFGQVVGSEFTVQPEAKRATSLEVWGLYYNYENFDEAPPAQDDFTLRFHDVTGGDPEESIASEYALGSGTRVDTGQILNGQIDLAIYSYAFDLTPFNIVLDPGATLISVINDVGSLAQAQDGGYWHWANGGGVDSTFFRRENALDPQFAGQPQNFKDTFNWTELTSTGSRAFALEAVAVPVPSTLILLLAALMALGGVQLSRARATPTNA